MFATLPSSLLFFLVTVVGQIPAEPDFSGEWMLVETTAKSPDLAPSLTVRQTITRTTMRGDPMTPWWSDFTVERHFRNGVVASASYKIGTISGTVSGRAATPASSLRPDERTTVGVT